MDTCPVAGAIRHNRFFFAWWCHITAESWERCDTTDKRDWPSGKAQDLAAIPAKAAKLLQRYGHAASSGPGRTPFRFMSTLALTKNLMMAMI